MDNAVLVQSHTKPIELDIKDVVSSWIFLDSSSTISRILPLQVI